MTQLFGNGPSRQAARDEEKQIFRILRQRYPGGPREVEPGEFENWEDANRVIKSLQPRSPLHRFTVAEFRVKEGRDTITKVKGGYEVKSEKTSKNLGGPYPSKAAAKKRLAQVEYFKGKK